MIKLCSYCNRKLYFRNHYQWMAHRSNCEFNPNQKEKLRKMRFTKSLLMKEYNLICFCGKPYTLKLTERKYKKGNYRKHCSQSCANSHIQTQEQNEKRRIKSTKHKIETRICSQCNKNFFVKENNRKRFCSKSCSGKYTSSILNSRKFNLSKIVLNSYKNGRIPKGRTYADWMSYGDIKIQGTYELRTCYILDMMKEVGDIKDWGRNFDRFPYMYNEDEHSYFPDFKITGKDDRIYYIEVKGRIYDIDRLKWKSLEDKLEIWKIEDIKNFEMLYGILIINFYRWKG